jgi:hypothetical protein
LHREAQGDEAVVARHEGLPLDFDVPAACPIDAGATADPADLGLRFLLPFERECARNRTVGLRHFDPRCEGGLRPGECPGTVGMGLEPHARDEGRWRDRLGSLGRCVRLKAHDEGKGIRFARIGRITGAPVTDRDRKTVRMD